MQTTQNSDLQRLRGIYELAQSESKRKSGYSLPQHGTVDSIKGGQVFENYSLQTLDPDEVRSIIEKTLSKNWNTCSSMLFSAMEPKTVNSTTRWIPIAAVVAVFAVVSFICMNWKSSFKQ